MQECHVHAQEAQERRREEWKRLGLEVGIIDWYFSAILGRSLGYLMFSLMALIGGHVYQYVSMGFRGQPRITIRISDLCVYFCFAFLFDL